MAYDVMPPEPLEEWKSEAFEPEVRDGIIYARGADDDKGQTMCRVKGLEPAIKAGSLEVQCQGDAGGRGGDRFAKLGGLLQKAHKELLKSDHILVSDTGVLRYGQSLYDYWSPWALLLADRDDRPKPRLTLRVSMVVRWVIRSMNYVS